ncbi:MAG TPA: glycoside hydrolase family 25 protein [Candidatus Limnocylindria bacterium]|nr:glycoside hydrolase family 25 protein [Candidatus Limnocylindria bacterium]
MRPSHTPRRFVLPLTLAACLLLTMSSPVEAARLSSYARAGHLLGIDVSHWQGIPRWKYAKPAGVRFVIAKATEAQGWVDSQFARNKRRADALGIPFTAYHFARPDRTTDDALREADHFVRTAGLAGRHLLPVLDLEVTGGLGPKRLIEWTRTWLRRVEARLGVKPMIYTSPSFWLDHMNDSRWFADNGYRLWIAHWGARQPTVPASNWGGRGWTLWQVSDCGQVRGISGCVDVDLYRGTRLAGLKIVNNR